jgi:hypothetical protein
MVFRKPKGVNMLRLSAYALSAVLTVFSALSARGNDIHRSFTYDFDLREAVEGSDHLGLDFDVSYELSRESESPAGHQFEWAFSASGFQNFDNENPDLNHMKAEVSLRGRYYRPRTRDPLPPRQLLRYLEIAGIVDTLQTEEESLEFDRLDRQLFGGARPRYISYDLHYRIESSQDFAHTQHVGGIGVSAEVPLLQDFLDLVPSVTRASFAPVQNFRTPPVRLYVGLDYVASAEAISESVAEGDKEFARARIETAWSTLVFEAQVLKIAWQGEYMLDASKSVEEADREFNTFLEASLIIPLKGKTGILVKYVDGRLPPVHNQVSAGMVGLNFYLQ